MSTVDHSINTDVHTLRKLEESDIHPHQSLQRFLSHDRGSDAPLDGENLDARAAVDENGFCIEYRETKLAHVKRLGLIWRANTAVSWT